jgi:hypothetical protein
MVFQAASPESKLMRLTDVRAMGHAALESDRNVVAIVQSMEALLVAHAGGKPGGIVVVNGDAGGLVMHLPGSDEPVILYQPPV